jgi:hypothetical protein
MSLLLQNNVIGLWHATNLKQQIIFFFFKRKMTKVLFGLMEHNEMKWIRVEWNRAE